MRDHLGNTRGMRVSHLFGWLAFFWQISAERLDFLQYLWDSTGVERLIPFFFLVYIFTHVCWLLVGF